MLLYYCDVIMGAVASQITSLTIVYSTVYSDADQRKQTSKLRVIGLCAGNAPGTAQMASNAENVSIWWRHHDTDKVVMTICVTFGEDCITIYVIIGYWNRVSLCALKSINGLPPGSRDPGKDRRYFWQRLNRCSLGVLKSINGPTWPK